MSLLLVPAALGASSAGALGEFLGEFLGPEFVADGGLFAACILLWSAAVAAQGPALAAVGQQLAPKGAEATALAFPRAIGDGVYVVAPAALGLVADALGGTPGAGTPTSAPRVS